MRITLPFVCILCLAAASCAAPRWKLLDRKVGDFTPYGTWDVRPVQVATNVPHNWAGRKDQDLWKTRVRNAADFIGEETKRKLDEFRPEGKPMRVQLKMVELKPAKGWGGIGKAGDLIVNATFYDSVTGEMIGTCRARNFPTADPFTDPTLFLSDIAEVFVMFVDDHSD